MKLFLAFALLLHTVLGSPDMEGWHVIHKPSYMVHTKKPVKASDEVLALVRDHGYRLKVVESDIEGEGITPRQLKGFLVHLNEFRPTNARIIVDMIRMPISHNKLGEAHGYEVDQRSMLLRDYIKEIRSRLGERAEEPEPAETSPVPALETHEASFASGFSFLAEDSADLQGKAMEEVISDSGMAKLIREAVLIAVQRIQAKETSASDSSGNSSLVQTPLEQPDGSKEEMPENPDAQFFAV